MVIVRGLHGLYLMSCLFTNLCSRHWITHNTMCGSSSTEEVKGEGRGGGVAPHRTP